MEVKSGAWALKGGESTVRKFGAPRGTVDYKSQSVSRVPSGQDSFLMLWNLNVLPLLHDGNRSATCFAGAEFTFSLLLS